MLNLKKKISKIIVKKRVKKLEDKKELWQQIKCKDDRKNIQLKKFNKVWQYAYSNFQIYKKLKTDFDLPDAIKEIDQIKKFPILKKKDLLNYSFELKKGKKYKYTSTGGTSGTILRVPQINSDSDFYHCNMYLGRSWSDFKIGDECFFIWGHSNQFTTDKIFDYKYTNLKNFIKDTLIFVKRFNAYDISTNNFDLIINKINQANKKVNIVGYSSFIRKLCYYIKDKNIEINNKKIKNVILTSEKVYDEDKKLVLEILGKNLVLEYGMAEFGPIAYSSIFTDRLIFFWDSFYTHSINENLYVTNLDNVYFPLINYETGDKIEKYDDENKFPNISKVIGRANDDVSVKTKNGKILIIHSEFFTHLIKNIDGVRNFKIVNKNYFIYIYLEINYKFTNNFISIEKDFMNKILLEFPSIDKKNIKLIDKKINVELTNAGKEKFIEKL